MTWSKFGSEFSNDCAEVGLSDAAYRTHSEAIIYLYCQENFACTLKKSTMRRWSGSDQAGRAAAELVAAGFWRDGKTEWTVVHHADVIRQSLAAQLKKREDDKAYQHKKREEDKARQEKKRRNVGNDVGNDVGATHTDRHTYKQPGKEGAFRSDGERDFDPWETTS